MGSLKQLTLVMVIRQYDWELHLTLMYPSLGIGPGVQLSFREGNGKTSGSQGRPWYFWIIWCWSDVAVSCRQCVYSTHGDRVTFTYPQRYTALLRKFQPRTVKAQVGPHIPLHSLILWIVFSTKNFFSWENDFLKFCWKTEKQILELIATFTSFNVRLK